MISIIIPTKNEISVIGRTLQGFRGAKKRHFEIIVSDGGSTDGTVEVARKYADKVITHDGMTRQTIAFGKNAGARAATGEYLAFFDADVTILNIDEFFDTALSLLKRYPDIVAFTGHLRVLPEHETLSDRFFFGLVNHLHFIQNNFLRIGAASGEFQMMRRDVFLKLGGYREDLTVSEDQEFFRRLAKNGRTHFHRRLTVHHTGRRAHKIGWLKMLILWFLNDMSVRIFNKSSSVFWKEIR